MRSGPNAAAKRVADVIGSSVALLLLGVPMLAVAVIVRLDSPGPALFRQSRVGAHGRPFEILKFRSMSAGTATVESKEVARLSITRVGRFLRRTNVDELPQLINILKGDMSIVGPRPALPTQLRLLELRNSNGAAALRPGLTGLAQIRSYDGMPDDVKAAHDGEYAAQARLSKDLAIVLSTFGYLAKPPPTY